MQLLQIPQRLVQLGQAALLMLLGQGCDEVGGVASPRRSLDGLLVIDPGQIAQTDVLRRGQLPPGVVLEQGTGGSAQCGQIPVERLSKNAVGAYDAAVEAVREGGCVVVYPEGTLTRDPLLWPMTGKSGAARIALETGCPVIPIGQWGVQELLPQYAKKPDLFPRKTLTMKCGDPVDLSDLLDQPRTPEVVRVATARIMEAITEIVAELRGETPPTERFDPRKAGVRQTGLVG